MEKGATHRWHAISFTKDTLWSLNFKNHENYTILMPQYFSNSILIQKFIFLKFFSPWLREKGYRLLDFDSRERKVSLTPI